MAVKEVVLQKKQSDDDLVHTRKLSRDDPGLDRLRDAAATQVLQS